jgi:hypothetical protein
MTTQCDFVKYHRLEKKVHKAITEAEDGGNWMRVVNLKTLRRKCFPTKEEAIEDVESFFCLEEVPIY